MQENYMGRGYLIVLLATIILVAFSWLQPQIPYLGTQLQSYDLFELVRNDGNTLSPGADSADHVQAAQPVLAGSGIYPAEVPGNYRGYHHLESYFQAIKRLKHKKDRARIAYFGDSMIEGDLITQSLRSSMQERYGGQGVGFVPLASIAPGFRRSIRQNFSSDWKHFTCMKSNPNEYNFGISGEYFLPGTRKSSWVEFKASTLYPQTKTFQKIKMYYGEPANARANKDAPGSVKFTTGLKSSNEIAETHALSARAAVNELSLADQPTKDARVSFQFKQDVPIYGFSFEDEDPGLYLDNFSVRGHSGMRLKDIPGPILSQFQEYFGYNLVVLHFGLNVMYMYERYGSFDRYKKGMVEVVEHFKKEMPGTAILMVSVTDKSERVKGKMRTSPAVTRLVETQMQVAEECDVAFLNLYEAMGGANSMVKWVEGDPALANKDYAHVNFKGADRLAELIEAYLTEGYQFYDPADSHPIAGLGDLLPADRMQVRNIQPSNQN